MRETERTENRTPRPQFVCPKGLTKQLCQLFSATRKFQEPFPRERRWFSLLENRAFVGQRSQARSWQTVLSQPKKIRDCDLRAKTGEDALRIWRPCLAHVRFVLLLVQSPDIGPIVKLCRAESAEMQLAYCVCVSHAHCLRFLSE